MLIYDENGETLDTASNLRAKFEALQMHDSSEKVATDRHQENFRVKRFKVRLISVEIYTKSKFC